MKTTGKLTWALVAMMGFSFDIGWAEGWGDSTWYGAENCLGYPTGWHCPAGKEAEFGFKRSDGSTMPPHEGYATVCPCFNNPGYIEHTIAQIEDRLKKNPAITRLFLDEFWWGGYGEYWCCCDSCKKKYRARFGKEMPIVDRLEWGKMTPAEMRQNIEWRRDGLEEAYLAIAAKAKAVRPNISVTVHGVPGWYDLRGELFCRLNSLRISDLAYIEQYHDEIFWVAWLRGMSRSKTSMHTPYMADHASRTAPMIKYVSDAYQAVTAGMLAEGCYEPCTTILADGKNTEAVQQLVAREVKENRPYLEGASPVLYAAIVYSDDVKIYYGRHDASKSPIAQVRGAWEVMQKLHVPVEFINELDLKLETLKQFKVVILPNVTILTPPQVAAIRQYVQEGGSLLATFETGLYDQYGERGSDFSLADVFGLKYEGVESVAFPRGTIISPREGLLTHLQDTLVPRQDNSLFISAPFAITKPIEGITKATCWAVEVGDPSPLPLVRSKPSNIPAVHVNHFGKGKAVYISLDLFKMYPFLQSQPGSTTAFSGGMSLYFNVKGWMADLIGEVVDWLAPNPPVRTEGSSLLACTFFEQKERNRLIVHLYNPSIAMVGEAFNLPPSKIVLQKDFAKPQKVYSAWPEKKALTAKDRGEYLEIMTPETQTHQIVVIER